MKKVIVLLGPTGVGKTSVSLLIAKALDTEIISADSMQIYRHMDVGTAKPSHGERRAVTHHMIDIVDPWDFYSTGEYVKHVAPIIDGLHRRGRVPLVVGGTGLYIKAMTRGIFVGPSADWELRTELLRRKSEGEDLHDTLRVLDQAAASKIMPSDTRRIVRALEVCLRSHQTISELHLSLTRAMPYDFVKIGITRDRGELYRLIEERVDAMMATGLLEEVREVMSLIAERGGSQPVTAFPSMQAIGYKELMLHLTGEVNLQEAIRLVKKRSRNYAKRQFTWFRKEAGIRWVDATGVFGPEAIFAKAQEAYASVSENAPTS
ncbi:MAG TPA: tRNA (adenosine(37)-N6)-dimethylallyltransferase MiaA [Dissulfurispiraceae bacterium]|nr:tRNA (adenosine(37)-N6)-dimethylallyltransferase MiaA [Dissulfurispiraceae bacterium]